MVIGHFDADNARLAGSMLHRLERVEDALAGLDAVIAEACRPWAHQLELLQTIPAVGPKVAQVICAETGGDMSRFPSAAHLAAWAGLAPATRWLGVMLVEAVGSVGRMKGANYPSTQHARLTTRRGMAGRPSRSRTRCSSRPTTSSRATSPTRKADWLARRDDAAHTRRLVAHLERLGHTVILHAA